MERKVLILFIAGLLCLVGGGILIVLVLETDILKTKQKSLSAGATIADAVTDGQIVANKATISWLPDGVGVNSSGACIKWSSTVLGHDLVPITVSTDGKNVASVNALPTKTANSNIGVGVSTTSATSLGSIRSNVQTWDKFPRMDHNRTIVIVGAQPFISDLPFSYQDSERTRTINSAKTGLSFLNYNGSRTACKFLAQSVFDGSANPLKGTTPTQRIHANLNDNTIPEGTNVLNWRAILGADYATTANGTTNNVIGISLDVVNDTLSVYINGSLSYSTSTTATEAAYGAVAGNPSDIALNSDGKESTIYSMLVYDHVAGPVLTSKEHGDLSTYLAKTYFAPAISYPTEVKCPINTSLNITNAFYNLSGVDPIYSYEITPVLSAGLSMTTDNYGIVNAGGKITGTPSGPIGSTKYTIFVENNYTKAASTMGVGGFSGKSVELIITLQSVSSTGTGTGGTGTTETTNPPNITYPIQVFKGVIGESVNLAAPTNSGGAITSYSISPNISSFGLSLNQTSGIITGTITNPTNVICTITGTSANGSTSTCSFRLILGLSISYNNGTTLVATKDIEINPFILSVFFTGTTEPVLGSYTIVGSLFGLTFNATNGMISGTPTSTGSSTITVAIVLSNGTSSNTQLNIVVGTAPTNTANTGPEGTDITGTVINTGIKDEVTTKSTADKNKSIYLGIGGGIAGIGVGLMGTGYYFYRSAQPIPQSTPQISAPMAPQISAPKTSPIVPRLSPQTTPIQTPKV